MNVEELPKPEDLKKEIERLNEQLEKNEGKEYIAEIKAKLNKQSKRLENREDIADIKEQLMRIETDIMASEIMSSIRYKEINKEESKKLRDEVSKIVDSLSDKKEETIRRPKVKYSKPKRYFPLNAIKGKINKIVAYIKESERFKFKNKTSDIIKRISDIMTHINEQKRLTPKDKMKGIIDLRSKPKNTQQKTNPIRTIRNGIKSLTYKPQHAMPNRYVAKGREMVGKIRFLASNVGKSIVAKVLNARKNIARNIDDVKRLRAEAELENKFAKSKPKANESERYTAEKGTKSEMREMKKRFGATLVAAAMGLAFVPASLGSIAQTLENRRNNALDETVRVTSEMLNEMGNSIQLDKQENSQIENNNNKKPTQSNSNKQEINNSNKEPAQSNTNKPEINNNNNKPAQSNTNKPEINNNNNKPAQSNTNKPEINNSDTKPIQSNSNKQEMNNNAKPEENNKNNEIKKIYGGEISASENGIRTEEDILYAVKQIGWSEDRVENIKEMMPALLDIQRDFDIDPLCALAVFQGESGCGTKYTQYGQYRLANIEYWVGELEVVGYSGLGYGCYNNFNSAAYDFGNYVRNGPPYSDESPALTMKDLKEHGDKKCIFNNADTKYAAIYNQLKSYLKKKVTVDHISKVVKECTTSEIKEVTKEMTKEMTAMSAQKHNSVNKEMSTR